MLADSARTPMNSAIPKLIARSSSINEESEVAAVNAKKLEHTRIHSYGSSSVADRDCGQGMNKMKLGDG